MTFEITFESKELLIVAKEEITRSYELLNEHTKKSSKSKKENNQKVTKIINE